MSTIHARFWVQKVELQAVAQGQVQRTVHLAPVVRPTPLDDGKGNVDWSKYTPSGSITLSVSNESAGRAFEEALGKDVSITFEILEPEPVGPPAE